MKHLKPILFLLGIILSAAFGCEKNEDQKNIYWELPVNGSKTAIVNTINGIEFKFCLINENGVTATSFIEGQNFSFLLALTNKTSDSLHLDNSFFQPSSNFCKVYDSNNALIGLPFIFKWRDEIGSAAHPFYGMKDKYELTVPWKDDRNEWQTINCHFESTHQNLLPKGEYYTIFTHRFCFDHKNGKPNVCTDSLIFKINFEIK